jgi:hypothetical protein
MRRKAPNLLKRPDLHPDALWSFAADHLSPEYRALWSSDPVALAFAKALVSYVTHLVPGTFDCSKSLAVECLSSVPQMEPVDVDIMVDAALRPIPAVLRWQVYTYRKGSVSVWDPISGSLSNFLNASPLLPRLAPAPVVEGCSPDPEALRFLLRSKLLHMATSFIEEGHVER